MGRESNDVQAERMSGPPMVGEDLKLTRKKWLAVILRARCRMVRVEV